jgi:hypothetical protein
MAHNKVGLVGLNRDNRNGGKTIPGMERKLRSRIGIWVSINEAMKSS